MPAGPLVAILLHRDYWRSDAASGNGVAGYRPVREIQKALTTAGARPRLVYHTDAAARPDRFQGVVLPGGGDLDPRFYGQPPVGDFGPWDADLDAFQLRWARHALRTGRPMLGICRGMQVMNVAAGGTLVQDIASQLPGRRNHSPGGDRREVAHPLRTAAGSDLARLLGRRPRPVNSIHHQCVDRLAPAFHPAAWADDGVLEALERPLQRGVQFHPEDLRHGHPAFQRLFEGLVEEASTFRV